MTRLSGAFAITHAHTVNTYLASNNYNITWKVPLEKCDFSIKKISGKYISQILSKFHINYRHQV